MDSTQTPHQPFRTLTALDLLVAIALLSAGALLVPSLRSHQPALVKVHVDNRVVARYPLSDSLDCTIQGAIGPLTVRIRHGQVSVVHATCPRGVCTAYGAVARPGQQIVCAPNHVIVEVTSAQAQERPDAVAQ